MLHSFTTAQRCEIDTVEAWPYLGCIEETVGPLMRVEREVKGNKKRANAQGVPGLAYSGRTDAGVSAYGQVLAYNVCEHYLEAHRHTGTQADRHARMHARMHARR